MATDWKALARARQLNIPDADLDRVIAALDTLETAFRALARAIPHDIEPAITFHLAEETE